MSQKLNYCPRTGATKAPKNWPRVYAQRHDTAVIFEIHRGALSHSDCFSDSNGAFGREWSVWIERRPDPKNMLGAHSVRTPLSAAA